MAERGALVRRRVFVTGAASGIGRAVALECIAAGARVFGSDVDESGLAEVARRGPLVGACDVRSLDDVERTIHHAAEALGGLDAVVNSAGVMRLGPVLEGDASEWRLMVETNLLGVLHITRTALDFLRLEPYADLINVSSLAGRRISHSRAAVYTATKAAVHALSDAMRMELSAHGIRTTVIAPGAVSTSLAQGISDATLRAEIQELHDRTGLDPSIVARQIVAVLALEPGTLITELGVQSVLHAAHAP